VWWFLLIIPTPGRLRKEDYKCKFKATIGYIWRPCLKKTKITPLLSISCIYNFERLSI
jgi:hypothetical protein